MARKLTTFSKILIVLVIVSILFFGITYLRDNGYLGDLGQENTEQANNSGNNSSSSTSSTSGSNTSKDIIKIGVVTWGGYAGGQYFNEGFEANKNSRFYKDYGFQVEFKVLDDFNYIF